MSSERQDQTAQGSVGHCGEGGFYCEEWKSSEGWQLGGLQGALRQTQQMGTGLVRP